MAVSQVLITVSGVACKKSGEIKLKLIVEVLFLVEQGLSSPWRKRELRLEPRLSSTVK
jgi:hypothetical protein